MRWTAARKAAIAQAMLAGELGMLEAIEKYDTTWEELTEWVDLFKAHGIKGLRTTRLLQYRPTLSRGRPASSAESLRPIPRPAARRPSRQAAAPAPSPGVRRRGKAPT